MATQDTYSGALDLTAEAATPRTIGHQPGHFGRSRQRITERRRRRMLSARHRRALAQGLRRTAAPIHPPGRFDICPVLLDRVAPLRPELLQLATALEQTHDPDPTSVALIHELLRDGCSPLYDPSVPAADLHAVLRCARAGLAAQPPA
jgi:hypothetical protein